MIIVKQMSILLKKKGLIYLNVLRSLKHQLKKSDYIIKSLKTNKGSEFFSNKFNEFCEDQGIKKLLIVSISPQKIEWWRENRSILNMAINMLKIKKDA
jgi:hypothetical protein